MQTIKEVKEYIKRRINNLNIEYNDYKESYERNAKYFNIEESSRNYRWMREARACIVEFEDLLELIGKGEEDVTEENQ